ncbi:response regulator [Nannocystis sp. ILAH1]|uniref:response regulator n=1 Tax=unclassified Nannocystis TaxID=2627009 RepID=UPI00226E43FC|nr:MULTISPECIES: response regulator [unclassified Nannocystis]MCY0991112.1 response regulator [Nannocystis sp. ILAH1]MCY1064624.1 response regulator [Nannocystis sp. RBIL2]
MPTILIIEDDSEIRGITAVLLRREGYVVEEARSGDEALTYLRRSDRDPCLILVDLMMPILGDWDVVDILRDEDRILALPVVVLSAAHPDKAPSGVSGFVRKPIDFDLLLGLVRRYCGPAPAG